MGFLDQVKSGKVKDPLFILLYGVPGTGKSTLASEAPTPLFFGDENESSQFTTVQRGPEPKTMGEVRDGLTEILNAKKLTFKTLVFDNLGWFEPLAFDEVCEQENKKGKGIESIGYGKGYKMAINKHLEVINLLKEIRKRHKVDIFVVGHSKVKTFQDPTISSAYDQYQLSINEEAANTWIRNVDAVLFMNYEIVKEKDDAKFAQGAGIRLLYSQERPAFKAKNRYGLPYKLVMPLGESYKTLISAIDKGQPESIDTLASEIDGLLTSVQDEILVAKVKKATVEAGKDAVKLTAIKDRLLAVIGGIK